jgi:methionyl-tRNA formyltransferase
MPNEQDEVERAGEAALLADGEMRVLAIVNGYTGALCLRELLDQGHEVGAVVTAPALPPAERPAESVVGTAVQRMLPLYMPPYEVVAEPRPQFIELLRRLEPDLLVSMHYPAIFKPAILEIPRLGAVNVHPSKLPEGRGMTPSWWYLYLGADVAWTTLHYLDPGVDSGDVIAQASVTITQEDTGRTLSRKLSQAAWQLFRDHLPAIAAGRAPRRKQNLREGSYIWASFDWGTIDWGRDAKGVRGHIRCLCESSDPARTFVGGAKVEVRDAEIAEAGEWSAAAATAQPGQVLGVLGRGIVVQTGNGQVVLTDYTISDDPKVFGLASLVAKAGPVIMGRYPGRV